MDIVVLLLAVISRHCFSVQVLVTKNYNLVLAKEGDLVGWESNRRSDGK